MDRIARRTIGLVALLALFASMAHSVWAFACMVHGVASAAASVFDDGGSHGAHVAMAPAARHHAAADTDHTGGDSSDHGSHRGSHSQAPGHECPHGEQGVAGGCMSLTTAPTAGAAIAAIPFGEQAIVVLSDILPRRQFATDVFRPPRV